MDEKKRGRVGMCYTCRAVTKEALQLLGDASYGGAAPLSLEHEAKHRARSLDLIRAPSTPPLQVAVGSIIRSHKCRCTDVCRNACTSAHALYTHTHTHIHTHTHTHHTHTQIQAHFLLPSVTCSTCLPPTPWEAAGGPSQSHEQRRQV
jgi:hypothetical protein